jgi:small subunit ribosomal protein S8
MEMFVNDRISDVLTRIRNINMRFYSRIFLPYTKLTLSLCQKIKDLDSGINFINDIKVFPEERDNGKLKKYKTICLKIKSDKIEELKRVSKPSRRIYMTVNEIKKISSYRNRIYLISTSKGIKTNTESIKEKIGGEVLLYIVN